MFRRFLMFRRFPEVPQLPEVTVGDAVAEEYHCQ